MHSPKKEVSYTTKNYALNVEISGHLSWIQGPLVYPYLVPFMIQVGLLWDTISSKWPLILVEGKMVGEYKWRAPLSPASACIFCLQIVLNGFVLCNPENREVKQPQWHCLKTVMV